LLEVCWILSLMCTDAYWEWGGWSCIKSFTNAYLQQLTAWSHFQPSASIRT
jgi:hypothetical protein